MDKGRKKKSKRNKWMQNAGWYFKHKGKEINSCQIDQTTDDEQEYNKEARSEAKNNFIERRYRATNNVNQLNNAIG